MIFKLDGNFEEVEFITSPLSKNQVAEIWPTACYEAVCKNLSFKFSNTCVESKDVEFIN
jgi:hypothetical protein